MVGIKRPGFSDFSLVTFGVTIGASATTIYTGTDLHFLIKKLYAVNDTAGALDFELSLGSNVIIPATSIGSKAESLFTGLDGLVIPPSLDLTATGENLYVYGWGYPVSKFREINL